MYYIASENIGGCSAPFASEIKRVGGANYNYFTSYSTVLCAAVQARDIVNVSTVTNEEAVCSEVSFLINFVYY